MTEETIQPLIHPKTIARRVGRLALEIGALFGREEELVLVGLLKGGFVFLADLIRRLHAATIPLSIDFMRVSSYGEGTESHGEVRILKDIDLSIEGKNVLVVDDIFDSGYSLAMVLRHLEGRKPKRLVSCVLLEKQGRRKVSLRPDLVGFQIPDVFVVGYGLDYAERFRELPFIGVYPTFR